MFGANAYVRNRLEFQETRKTSFAKTIKEREKEITTVSLQIMFQGSSNKKNGVNKGCGIA